MKILRLLWEVIFPFEIDDHRSSKGFAEEKD